MKTIRTVQIIEDTAMAAAESKERTNKIIKAFIAEIKLALCKGDAVALREFGTFNPIHRAERQGHNPATGESITIPAKDTVTFPYFQEVQGYAE